MSRRRESERKIEAEGGSRAAGSRYYIPPSGSRPTQHTKCVMKDTELKKL